MNFFGEDLSSPLSFYFIAEIGVNHGGDIDIAKRLIDAAVEGGAHAVKFQTYKAETIAAKDAPSYWDNTKENIGNQFELFKKFDGLNRDDYLELKEYCDKHEIIFCSTAFDLEAVEWLTDIMPFFKVASADITNFPLLRRIASKGKPVILSTGASTVEEISSAIQELEKHGAQNVAILHCILNYPTKKHDANLNMISNLIHHFPNKVVGYSDHTEPDARMSVITTAVLLGAKIIEKHFTLDKTLPGNDHYHSMDKNDLKKLFISVKDLQNLVGNKPKNFLDSEKSPRLFARRSLHFNKNIKKGGIVTESDFIALRPATGVSPMLIDFFVGKKLKENVSEYDRVDEQHFE